MASADRDPATLDVDGQVARPQGRPLRAGRAGRSPRLVIFLIGDERRLFDSSVDVPHQLHRRAGPQARRARSAWAASTSGTSRGRLRRANPDDTTVYVTFWHQSERGGAHQDRQQGEDRDQGSARRQDDRDHSSRRAATSAEPGGQLDRREAGGHVRQDRRDGRQGRAGPRQHRASHRAARRREAAQGHPGLGRLDQRDPERGRAGRGLRRTACSPTQGGERISAAVASLEKHVQGAEGAIRDVRTVDRARRAPDQASRTT